MNIRIRQIDDSLPLPALNEANPATGVAYPANQVAGFDLYCRESIVVAPHHIELVPLNVAIEVPEGYFLLLTARSSTPWKKGLMLANGVGVVAPFYRGDKDELKAQLYNITDKPVQIEKGEALVQGVILKFATPVFETVTSFGAPGHGGYKTNQNS